MYQEMFNGVNDGSRAILLVADCWSGAKAAGRFAAKLLFDHKARIILLNTYQRPATGTLMTRSIEPILKKTAMKDLDVLRKSLEEEYGIPPEKIETIVIEEELSVAIKNNFSHFTDHAIVLGQNIHNPFRKGSCRKVIQTLMQSSSRPVFLVSDYITLLEKDQILIISEKEEDVSNLYINFLREIHPEEDIHIEIIARDRPNRVKLNKITREHLARRESMPEHQEGTPEQIFYDLVIREAEG